MDSEHTPLIVGAGPVGLAAALLLNKRGIDAQIIEAKAMPSATSRALAVNPRTLDLLEDTGITAKMLERGLKIHEVHMHEDDKLLARVSLSKIRHRYPFLLALSQASTEKLLAEELQKLGKEVRRGVKLTECTQLQGNIQVALDDSTMQPSWLLAADGAHSVVREKLNLDFDGSSMKGDWYLMDVPLATSLQEDAAHICFSNDGGFLFMLRVVEDIRQPAQGDPIWRLIANFPNLLERVPNGKASGEPIWKSQFHISHRIASHLNVGNIYLAGDAAHIHSPMGARGMNLGIEDAWTFAELMKAGTPERYGEIRRRIDARVVRRVEFITNMANGGNSVTRFLRRHLFPLLPHVPLLFKLMSDTADGLDHEVEL